MYLKIDGGYLRKENGYWKMIRFTNHGHLKQILLGRIWIDVWTKNFPNEPLMINPAENGNSIQRKVDTDRTGEA